MATPPSSMESMTRQLPTPVATSSSAPSRMARVEVSPTLPGIDPTNMLHHVNPAAVSSVTTPAVSCAPSAITASGVAAV